MVSDIFSCMSMFSYSVVVYLALGGQFGCSDGGQLVVSLTLGSVRSHSFVIQ